MVAGIQILVVFSPQGCLKLVILTSSEPATIQSHGREHSVNVVQNEEPWG